MIWFTEMGRPIPLLSFVLPISSSAKTIQWPGLAPSVHKTAADTPGMGTTESAYQGISALMNTPGPMLTALLYQEYDNCHSP